MTLVKLVQCGCSRCGLRGSVSDVVLMEVMALIADVLVDLVLALVLFAIFDRLGVKMMVSAIAWHCFVGVIVGVSSRSLCWLFWCCR